MDQASLAGLRAIQSRICSRMWSGAQNKPTIAGGAVRNCWCDLPVRDIDIFVEHEAHIDGLCDLLDLEVIRPPLGKDANGCSYPDSDVSDEQIKVWKCQVTPYAALATGRLWPWDNFDLIWVPSIQGRIDIFPDYISRCWMSYDGQLNCRPEAIEDKHRERIRYHGSKMREARLARLKELYPSFEFVDLDAASITLSTGRKRREPDHAPFWWEMATPSPESAMDAVRAMSEAYR